MKIWYVFMIFLVLSCGGNDSHITQRDSSSPPAEQKGDILEQVDNDERIVWQKPEEVVRILGDISEKTIADIGAGSGYFTFRFALKAEKVIAVDIDPVMIKIIETFKQQLPAEIQDKIETRLTGSSDPGLSSGEADVVVIINTIGYIDNRVDYLRRVADGIAEGGEIFILDFKAKRLSINAPEMQYRVPLGTLEQEVESAGFDIFDSDDQTLDYQYIVRARIK